MVFVFGINTQNITKSAAKYLAAIVNKTFIELHHASANTGTFASSWNFVDRRKEYCIIQARERAGGDGGRRGDALPVSCRKSIERRIYVVF